MTTKIIIGLAVWLAAQPVLCVGFAHVMRHRRAAGGN